VCLFSCGSRQPHDGRTERHFKCLSGRSRMTGAWSCGHEHSLENTQHMSGRAFCRECRRKVAIDSYHRRRRGESKPRPSLMDRVSGRIEKGSYGECWIWTGARDEDGYGRVWANGTTGRAHRVIFEALKGAIPEGLVLDHLCHTPSCVNPDHLEPVTIRENVRRGREASSSGRGGSPA